MYELGLGEIVLKSFFGEIILRAAMVCGAKWIGEGKKSGPYNVL